MSLHQRACFHQLILYITGNRHKVLRTPASGAVNVSIAGVYRLLLREAVASYMAANVGFLGINGVLLHRDAREVFSRA
jgi:hypothetical protein